MVSFGGVVSVGVAVSVGVVVYVDVEVSGDGVGSWNLGSQEVENIEINIFSLDRINDHNMYLRYSC